jgi:hypothetical protein
LGFKISKVFDADPDPGSGIFLISGSEMETSDPDPTLTAGEFCSLKEKYELTET